MRVRRSANVKKIELSVRGASSGPLPAGLRKKWGAVFSDFDDIYSIPYLVFLGELLSIFTHEPSRFSGFKKTNTGIGEERWDLSSGGAGIYRELITELSDGWQRVETHSDRVQISGIKNKLAWDGEYSAFGGMKITLTGMSAEKKKEVLALAKQLFDEVQTKNVQ